MAKWSIPPVRLAGLIKEELNRAARAIALDILSRIMVLSPVDTGRFRGNWQIDIQSPAMEALERLDRAGQATVMTEAQKLLAYRLGQTITMRNNVPYSVRLEYGWSAQAPAGMVRVTLSEAQQIADKVAAGLRARRGA